MPNQIYKEREKKKKKVEIWLEVRSKKIPSPLLIFRKKKRKERKTNESIRQENLKTRFQKTFLNSVLNSKVYQKKKKKKSNES